MVNRWGSLQYSTNCKLNPRKKGSYSAMHCGGCCNVSKLPSPGLLIGKKQLMVMFGVECLQSSVTVQQRRSLAGLGIPHCIPHTNRQAATF